MLVATWHMLLQGNSGLQELIVLLENNRKTKQFHLSRWNQSKLAVLLMKTWGLNSINCGILVQNERKLQRRLKMSVEIKLS